jgi:GntR family transcriptional regulator
MERYAVARQTVQNAIEQLRSEGLITSTPGGRVQVRARRPIQRLARSRLSRGERSEGRGTFLTDAAVGQWRPEVDVTLRAQTAGADVAEELRIAEGSEVFVRDRVMRADGVPVQLATSYLPRDLTRGTVIEQHDTGPGGIYARLEENGHPLDRFTEVVTSRLASSDEAAALHLATATPVLALTRIAHTTDGRAVEMNDMVLPGDRFELVYEFPADS